MSARARAARRPPVPPRAEIATWKVAAAIGLLAFALRLLFVLATDDRSWPYSLLYKGDAWVWITWAQSLLAERPFELGLPMRPPGVGYLVAALWDGSVPGLATLRIFFCALGAAVPALLTAAARPAFGLRVATTAGLLAAGANGLLQLSASVAGETPYLVLVLLAWLAFDSVRRGAGPTTWAAFGAISAVACLIRVEHLLLFGLLTVLALVDTRGRPARARRIGVLALAGGFALALVPWHVHAWRAVRSFNATEPVFQRAAAPLAWSDEAERVAAAWPGFARPLVRDFVDATLAWRGSTRVEAADLDLLDAAFGARPEALPGRPFVALYGPLNFALAHHPEAGVDFSRQALSDPPPLASDAAGADAWPPARVATMPPPDLSFAYPPHNRLFVDGYRIGLGWIADHPGAELRRAAGKLGRFTRGTTLGLTGWNLPLGASGIRHPVDLTLAELGPLAIAWTTLLLAGALAGAVAARDKRRDLLAWLLWPATQLIVTVAFFGYGRLGAMAIPVLCLLLALAIDRVLLDRLARNRPTLRMSRLALAAAALLLTLEGARWASDPVLTIDNRPILAGDPFPADDHTAHRIDARYRTGS